MDILHTSDTHNRMSSIQMKKEKCMFLLLNISTAQHTMCLLFKYISGFMCQHVAMKFSHC
jgi:hypothetical protein